jgi:hypothetical protein
MFIERSEVYFIVQADLEEAISRGEQARPMFSLMDARVALPVPGDKLVFANVKVLHQAGGNRTAAGFDPTLAIKHRHFVP